MRNVTIGGIVDFTINVTIEGFIEKNQQNADSDG